MNIGTEKMDNMNYSVAICTYNGERYIKEQLHSIINQSLKPSEIVISDDGSNDNTLNIINGFLKGCSIQFKIYENHHLGVANNFLFAYKHCEYPIIFSCDQDDVWMEDKAKVMLEVFQQYPNAKMVFSDGKLVDDNLQPLGGTLWGNVGIIKADVDAEEWFYHLMKTNLVTGAAMALKKDLLDNINTIPPSWIHDGWLAWKAAIENSLYACPHQLILYRQHSGNVIGMQPKNSVKKVKQYFDNISVLKQARVTRRDRFQTLLNVYRLTLNDKQLYEMNNCLYFWRSLVEMEGKNKLSQFSTIIRNMGGYQKYFTGIRGALRDSLSLFI